MSIRFKFRSSVSFDTLEIDGGKPYISVGELRSKIMCQKKLNNICHKDFDLVFFDAFTGQEYDDDKFKIPSGSSVIIKRVPAETVPSAMLRHDKLEASELSDDIQKGMDHNKPEEIVLDKNLAPEHGEHIKLEKVANAKGIDLGKVDLPSELRCPICNTYFKEAVMIPCCQHSFCQKCICEVLPLLARCPKCSSTEYRVEHLLPNLSLRHAIEHFLESQILMTAPEHDLQKYVPDGESGIQGKEISTVTKRKLDLLYSTSAAEKESNQNMAESVYESLNRKNVFLEGTGYRIGKPLAISLLNSTPSLKVDDSNGGRDRHEYLASFVDSQGENQPVMPQVCMPDEADSTSRKRGIWVNSGGGDRRFEVGVRNKKVDCTCYMCGSPNHFIRDCPMGSTERSRFHTGDPMFQAGMPGYAMPYWNAAAFPPVNPYMNMYGNPGMVPFNATMVPFVPYRVPPYVPSMYGNLPLHSGIPTMGGLAPVVTRAEEPLSSENLDLQNSDSRVKYCHEKRQWSFGHEDNGCRKRYDCHDVERSSEHKSHRDRGKALSNSEESHGRKLQKEHRCEKHRDQKTQSVHGRHEKCSQSPNDRRDHGSYHTDRSVSGVEDVHSGNYRYDEARYKQYCQGSRRHHNSREQSGSDCSCSRHQMRKERDVERMKTDVGDFQHKHKDYLSGLGASYSRDQKKLSKEVTHTHGSRETRDRKNPIAYELYGDRWKTASYVDDCVEGYHHNKRKRVH